MHAPLDKLKLLKLQGPMRTTVGHKQADQHRRDRDAIAAQQQSDTRDKLVMRFLPFIWLEDQNLEPVTLMETVAERLWVTAQKERQRRKSIHRNMYEQD